MILNINYFGLLTDITKVSNELLHFENSITVNQLLDKLNEKFPSFKVGIYAVAINNCLINDLEYFLKDNDTVAIMPPFAGG